jgi:uncharacterized iron-regulated membrane protein
MAMLKWSLRLHKWVGLVVGIQVLLWVLGGLVMTAIPIERVRSEHHLAEAAPRALPLAGLVSPQVAASAAGIAPVEATLRGTPRGVMWVLKDKAGATAFVDAATGAKAAPYGPDQARAFAAAAYKGEDRPARAELLAQAPAETGKTGPLWRVDFPDAERTTFYLSPETGEVVSRRSMVWRIYDFFWRLHIMDLETGENFNHPLVIGAAALSLVTTVTGLVLLWIRLRRDLQPARRAAQP